jgi:hypothetical protein
MGAAVAGVRRWKTAFDIDDDSHEFSLFYEPIYASGQDPQALDVLRTVCFLIQDKPVRTLLRINLMHIRGYSEMCC